MSQKKTKSSHRFYPLALTVAGSDSGGGAGIQADLRTFNAFGVFGTSVITAVTAQNPKQISRIEVLSPESVQAQLDSVLSCFAPDCIKSGMLPDEKIIRILVRAVEKYKLKLVCDPVLTATSGAFLVGTSAFEVLRNELLPRAEWITPNIPEAEQLLGGDIRITGKKELFEAARLLAERFGVSVLLKGGHGTFSEAVDAVVRGGRSYCLSSPRAEFPALAGHGTGCTLSAALAAGITLDYPWKQALCEAKSFVLGSLTQHVELASGVSAMYPPTEDCYELVKLEPAAD
ncbi:MAG: bifunctional hydroxymethylpyrimidine kinase/phosphomethylpyrimidine kinase [Lentisphaeria bacterium]|nr:bifunctional hydroxymethylpyrimidine kinase/phosphomethylpyrimidine kinase [Lentisphaeria bacterium]